ncbi:MAG: hypothetical protein L3J96_04425 [Thermoplasmata archaeon]|nr:hypothetical protein [Thermoplasmata archaeon]
MGTLAAWTVTVFLLIAGLLVLHHLGLNLGAVVGSSLHSIERALGEPLFFPD